jgi:orotate phosphoribosyltransferase
MKSTEKLIAEKLLQINAVKLNPQNPFTWASGIKSPIYCDNRLTLSYPQVRDVIVKSFFQKSAQFEPFDAIVGVATAGIPHGVLLADRLEKPFAYVRDKAKSHGKQNQIEGELSAGMRVLVIEDLISTGGSALKAAETLIEAGFEVVGVLAIFSYDFDKAKQAFEAAEIKFSTLTNYKALLEIAVEKSYISPSDLTVLEQWRQSPENWK